METQTLSVYMKKNCCNDNFDTKQTCGSIKQNKECMNNPKQIQIL